VIDSGAKEYFPEVGGAESAYRWWRRYTLTREVDDDDRAGGGILGVIGPGVGAASWVTSAGSKGSAGTRAIHPFRTFQADAQAPVGIVAEGKEENG